MNRSLTLVTVGALALSALAFNDGDPYEPVFNPERAFVHCSADKLTNANQDGPTTSTWDTEAPAGSVADGEGCGTADAVLSEEASETVVWEGTHTGNLDAMTIELYMIDAGIVRATHVSDGATGEVPEDPTGTLPDDTIPSLAFEDIWVNMAIYVDGIAAGWVGEAKMRAEYTNSDVTARMRMTLTDIGLLDEDEAGEHTIRIEFSTADYYNGDSGIWVWDTTEVPAGVDFSPAEEDYADFVVENGF